MHPGASLFLLSKEKQSCFNSVFLFFIFFCVFLSQTVGIGTLAESSGNGKPQFRKKELLKKIEVAPSEVSDRSDTAPAEWGERHDDLANQGSKAVSELRKLEYFFSFGIFSCQLRSSQVQS